MKKLNISEVVNGWQVCVRKTRRGVSPCSSTYVFRTVEEVVQALPKLLSAEAEPPEAKESTNGGT